jgi:hypothetical protein
MRDQRQTWVPLCARFMAIAQSRSIVEKMTVLENWVSVHILNDLSEDHDNLIPVTLFNERVAAAVASLPKEVQSLARLRVICGDAMNYFEIGYFHKA